MPTRPPTICSFPGCGVQCTSGRCEKHKRKAWATTTTSAHSRGYGALWRRIRKMKLAADPVCQVCGRAEATEVDHIKPKADGGTDDPINLQSICSGCHKAKTASE